MNHIYSLGKVTKVQNGQQWLNLAQRPESDAVDRRDKTFIDTVLESHAQEIDRQEPTCDGIIKRDLIKCERWDHGMWEGKIDFATAQLGLCLKSLGSDQTLPNS